MVPGTIPAWAQVTTMRVGTYNTRWICDTLGASDGFTNPLEHVVCTSAWGPVAPFSVAWKIRTLKLRASSVLKDTG